MEKIVKFMNQNLRVHTSPILLPFGQQSKYKRTLSLITTWDLGPLSQHHCVKDMLYPHLMSDHREINESDVKYVETCKLQKVNGTALTR